MSMDMIGNGYTATVRIPPVEDYLRLRRSAGLSPRSAAAAEAGLPHTVVGVVVTHDGRAVGMGRVHGDGLFYQVVDIAVEPEHQGKGIGKMIMTCLMRELRGIAPAEAYVSLIADGGANALYARFGFEPTAPASVGMAQWLGKEQA
jgi:ribosomal protein S18 acetylase RimI-like enzyme